MPHNDDDAEIHRLIAEQFSSLTWRHAKGPDARTFLAGFLPDALMVPARRPATTTTPGRFVDRMERLAKTTLSEFKETSQGFFVKRVGSVAVALASCEMLENNTTITRDVSAFLLVKDGHAWRIVAQAWDEVEDFRHFQFKR